jgi:cupin fold WbuC family metalloprotein
MAGLRLNMHTRDVTPEALAVSDAIVELRSDAVDLLKARLVHGSRGRMRILTHRDTGDQVQEMLIAFRRGVYMPPHKHIDKSESFHVVEGSLDVVVFADNGEVLEVIPMGDYHSGKVFFYRIADPLYHTLVVRSDVVVFHETSGGPFSREANVYASWAPDERDTSAAEQYLVELEGQLATRAETGR